MKLKQLTVALAIGVGQGAWLSAWAAGNVDQVRGEASVVNRDGQPRGLGRGDRVVEGETVVTGGDGEVLLTTDDSGVLAVRPRSRLVIETYRTNGTASDSVVLRLLRGGLRSITGWIGKTAPRNYRVTTPTATVGIRGTDHETAVVEDGPEAGSYDKVTSGETSLSTGAGSINIGPGQAGQAGAGDQPPRALPTPPPGIFPPRPSDERVDALKQDAEAQQAERLRVRQQQQQRSGGASEQGNPRVSAQCAPGSPAAQALDALLRAYERGDVGFMQGRLDPAMIGYASFLADVMNDNAAQRQTRVRMLETQMQCGPDVAVINFAWEKLFLESPTLTPRRVTGRSSVLITQLGSGLTGQWRISGLVGENPFKAPTHTTPGATTTPPAAGNGSAGSLTVSSTLVNLQSNPSGCVAGNQVGTAAATVSFDATALVASPCSFGAASYSCSITLSMFGPTPFITSPAPVTPSCTVAPVFTGSPVSQLVKLIGSASQAINAPGGSVLNLSIPVATSGSVSLAGPPSALVTGNAALACNLSVVLPSGAVSCTGAPSGAPVSIEVIDADVSAASVQVDAQASNGDRELLTLPQVSPGVFRLATLPITRGALSTVSGNGRFDLVGEIPGDITVTFKYTDALPGTGGVAQVRVASLVLQDPVLQAQAARVRSPANAVTRPATPARP